MIANFFKKWLSRNNGSHSQPGQIRFHVAEEVKASHHADGVVLIHMGRGTVFSANRVGALIWNGAARQYSLDQVSESISGEFHIPPQTAAQDASEFLEQLAAEGLLVRDAN